MTTERPDGSVGQKNKPLGRTRFRQISEVDAIHKPIVRGKGILFCLGKSVILGPYEIKTVQLPYEVEELGSLRGFDYCNSKNIRIWMKINSWGRMSVILKNECEHPQHVTPRARVWMMMSEGVVKEELRSMQGEDLTKEALMKEYPRVFDLSPKAMEVTEAMNKKWL